MSKFSIKASSLIFKLHPERDFEIIVGSERFQVSSFLAARVSRKINQLFIEDPISDEIELNIPEGDFQLVVDYISTGELKVTKENCVYLLHCAISLQSDSLQSIVLSSGFDISFEDSIELLKDGFEADMDCTEFAKVIGHNFQQFLDSPYSDSLNDFAAAIILKSSSANAEPKKIKDFITKRLEKSKNPNNILIQNAPFPFYTKEEITALISTKGFNINRMRSVLIARSAHNIQGDNSSVYIPLPGKYFDGIIHIFHKPVINASKCVPGYEGDILLESESKDEKAKYYCSETGPEAFIEFDFGNNEILADKYALKSWSGANNRVAPQSWVLSGSNDGKEWKVLHEVNMSSVMFSNSHVELFSIPKAEKEETYTKFQFKQIRCGNARNRVLALAGFEIFGKVKPGK